MSVAMTIRAAIVAKIVKMSVETERGSIGDAS
jgi:hypothetical protein